MNRKQVKRPAVTLLYALELLDESVKKTAIGPAYCGSMTQQVVAEAIERAKRRGQPKEIKPREDQMPLACVTK